MSQILNQDNSKILNQDNKILTKDIKLLQINIISAAAFAIYSYKKNHKLLVISLRDIKKILSNKL